MLRYKSKRFGKNSRQARPAADRVQRAVIDTLENRLLFTTYTVNTALDLSAPTMNLLSLRQAIQAANTDAKNGVTGDKIKFSVSGPFTVTTALPAITAPKLTIDGTGESVDINNGTGKATAIDGLEILGAGSGTAGNNTTFENVQITGFTNGIHLVNANFVTVTGDYLGTADGVTAAGNVTGVLIAGGQDDTISDSLISGNTKYGIELSGPKSISETISDDNSIGLNLGDTKPLPNKIDGIFLTGGASASIDNNDIGGNTMNGIEISGATSAAPVTITDNAIGDGVSGGGLVGIGNGADGVLVEKSTDVTIDDSNFIIGNATNGVEFTTTTKSTISDNTIGLDVTVPNSFGNGANGIELDTASSGNTIGGSASAGDGNTIFGNGNTTKNTGGGILVDPTSLNNAIEGNDIEDGNVLYGVKLASTGTALTGAASGTTLGGPSSDLANTITSNIGDGVLITGSYNTVQSNEIGSPTTVGNEGAGVDIKAGGSHNLIGSLPTSIFDGGNFIYNNGGDGVVVNGATSTKNTILYNLIAYNSGLSIDLLSGGNDSLPAPVLTQVLSSGAGHVAVTGTFNAPAAGTYDLQFYASKLVGPSGTGEGEFALGTITITAAAAGVQNFATTVLVGGGVPANVFFSATATQFKGGVFGDTSEFSNGVTKGSSLGQLSISAGTPTVDASKGAGTETFTVSLAQPNPGPGNITVFYDTEDGTAKGSGDGIGGQDYDSTSGTLTFLPGQSSQTVTVTVNAANANTLPTATYSVALVDPSGATIVNGQGIGTIVDTAVLPQASISVSGPASPIVRGAQGATPTTPTAYAEFVVTRTGTTTAGATVTYATQNGTATAGTDYQAESGTLIFTPNQTSEDIEVPIYGTNVATPAETFLVNISGATGGTIVTSQAQATIAAQTGTVTPPPVTNIGPVAVNADTGSTVNLNSLGTSDWAHFGFGFATATGNSQISNVTPLTNVSADYGSEIEGSGVTADPLTYSGTSSVTSDKSYIYAHNDVGAGYTFTVTPAVAGSHTLYLFLGGYDAVGNLTLSLGGGTPVTQTIDASAGHANFEVAIPFTSTTGQTLTVTYAKAAGGTAAGSVDLAGAALA